MARRRTVHPASEALGERLRRRRKEFGLTAKSVARAAGVSPSYLSQLERGKQDHPSLDVVGRLAGTLHLPLTDLVGVPQAALADVAPLATPEIPHSLAALATELRLDAEVTAMLSAIQLGGRQPATRDGWLLVLLAIRAACNAGAEDARRLA